MDHPDEPKTAGCANTSMKWLGILIGGVAGGVIGLLTSNFVPWLAGGLALAFVCCFGVRGGS